MGRSLEQLQGSAALPAGVAAQHGRDPRQVRGCRALLLISRSAAAALGAAVVLLGTAEAPLWGAEHESAASSDQPPATVEALPPEVATVRTVGWWTEAHRSGTYRIVITEHGFDKVVSRLYLQWLEPDEEAGPRILATVGFEQLNEVPLYHLEIAAIRPLQDGLEVELDGSSLYTGEAQTFLLRAGTPGTATLRPKP